MGTLLQNPAGVVCDSDKFAAWIRSFGRYSKSGGGDPAKSRILGMYDGHTISYKRIKNNDFTDPGKKGVDFCFWHRAAEYFAKADDG